MKTLALIWLSAVVLASPLFAAAPSPDAFKNDDERAIYAIGYQIGHNVGSFGFTAAELKLLQNGLRDSALGKPAAIDFNVIGPRVNEMLERRMGAAAAGEKKIGKAFADKFSKQEGVKPIPKGGWLQTLQEGKGAAPTADDTVKVHYRGTLINGTEFDSSYKRNEPATFPLNGVIPCWTNGVAQMKVGGKAKLVCPSDVAYGDAGRKPTILGGATLIFEIELLEVVKPAAEAPKAETKPVKK